MTTTVTFVDETTAGDRAEAWQLEVLEERLTLRELIRRRVSREVAEHNASDGQVVRGLVRPRDTEVTLNGYRLRDPRRVDVEEQVALALAAFSRNGFLVLVGIRQVTDLDEQIDLAIHDEVTFLTLVPLVGG